MLASLSLMLILTGSAQVPSPESRSTSARQLIEEYRAILDEEAARLTALAARLGKAQADAIRKRIEPRPDADGSFRFIPLPEVVKPSKTTDLPPEADAIRKETALKLFEVARKAANPQVKRFGLADRSLRALIRRDPDHAEARRLLGYLPRAGGWATPHAVERLDKGLVLHPVFGWVAADWVAHLDRGELPGAFPKGRKDAPPKVWLPAAEADGLRRQWDNAWTISTAPHFEVRTNVPLAEGVSFAGRLEVLHDLFLSEFADVVGAERLPLAQRFAKPGKKPTASPKRFEVSYFSTKAEYVDFFRRKIGRDESLSLGFYMPLSEARPLGLTPRSYFYKDEASTIGAQATLYHEASHQVLFETAGSASIDANRSNFWIWEGLGTYFETMQAEPDGSYRVGSPVGPRFESARNLIVSGNQYVKLADFSAMEKDDFLSTRDDAVYRHYAQAMALAVFFLHAQDAKYREPFLDFVADAYRGKVRSRSLPERLGVPFESLDREFLDWIKVVKK